MRINGYYIIAQFPALRVQRLRIIVRRFLGMKLQSISQGKERAKGGRTTEKLVERDEIVNRI